MSESNSPVAPRALFLDRDGVINQESGFVHRQEDVRFVPGIFSLCRTALSLGYRLFIVTNQAGIGRGLYSEADFHALMSWMQEELSREQIVIDAVYFSPYHPEHGIGVYKREHEDRKPGAGMLRRAAREFGIDLASSVMIGDRCTDIAAANSAGLCQAFLIAGTESDCTGSHLPIATLAEAETWLSENS